MCYLLLHHLIAIYHGNNLNYNAATHRYIFLWQYQIATICVSASIHIDTIFWPIEKNEGDIYSKVDVSFMTLLLFIGFVRNVKSQLSDNQVPLNKQKHSNHNGLDVHEFIHA